MRTLLQLKFLVTVAVLVFGAYWLDLPAIADKCGVCTTQRVMMCDESVCGPHPACMGGCECEEWNRRECNFSDLVDCKGTHSAPIPVTVHLGNCDAGTWFCVCRRSGVTIRQLRDKEVCTPAGRC